MKTRIRRLLDHALTLLLQTAVVLIALWSVGAMLGTVAVGFCMVAGCR